MSAHSKLGFWLFLLTLASGCAKHDSAANSTMAGVAVQASMAPSLFNISSLGLGLPALSGAISLPLTTSRSASGGGARAPFFMSDGSLVAVRTVGLPANVSAVWTYQSWDMGASWNFLSEIFRDTDADIGDGHVIQLKNGPNAGALLYSFRHNHIDADPTKNVYRIEVAMSVNLGRSWTYHSPVAWFGGAAYGLWSSFLLESEYGLQCYFDDEVTPAQQGLPGHQWLSMKTYSPATNSWESPVTVSRAVGNLLSRDGMASVTNFGGGNFLVTEESVRTEVPHTGVVRQVRSQDGGKTWSWSQPNGRPTLVAPADSNYNALAPWHSFMTNGVLVMAFLSDIANAIPDNASTGAVNQDLYVTQSSDLGETWSASVKIASGHVRLPGVAAFGATGYVLVQYAQLPGFGMQVFFGH